MILDLFAGPGGWSEGLRLLGMDDLGMEWDAAACSTRAAAGHRTIRTDVAAYPVEPFVGKVDGLIASPPCQSFSRAGSQKGKREAWALRQHLIDVGKAGEWRPYEGKDPRTALVLEPMRWALALRPRWIAMEQVEPVASLWTTYAMVLSQMGYSARVGAQRGTGWHPRGHLRYRRTPGAGRRRRCPREVPPGAA